MGEIREPIKRTSIEKKNRIIEKGFELMCEKGYHNVSSVDIAKYSGVSTGIIYQYFEDKRDIFIEGVKDYANKIMFPMINVLNSNKELKISNLEETISKMIDNFIKEHKMSKKAHEELMAMSHLDNEIGELFRTAEMEMTEKIVKIFAQNDRKVEKENIHIAYGIIDNFCHEVVYHKHHELDYEKMRNKVVEIVVMLMK